MGGVIRGGESRAIVIPAEAGIQRIFMPQADPPMVEILDSHFHGNDRKGRPTDGFVSYIPSTI
jgi:hypothetical protein